jgi:Leucine-rich repeat (LRR) protein
LSRNKITELPKAFTKLESLEHLWLDYNQLAALPIGFHKLVCLKELKLEGNKDLVFPPIHVVAKGTREVLKWCEMKYASKETSRTKYIILSVLSVLEQVGSHKVSASGYRRHESIFEQDVEYNGGKFGI